MGRWKDGHKYIRKIVIKTKDGKPALVYNLDYKGRIIYDYPVCLGIPAHIKYEQPGIYTFKPPPVQVYKKSLTKKDPSIVGCNSITITIYNPIHDQIDNSFKVSNSNLQKKDEQYNNNKLSHISKINNKQDNLFENRNNESKLDQISTKNSFFNDISFDDDDDSGEYDYFYSFDSD